VRRGERYQLSEIEAVFGRISGAFATLFHDNEQTFGAEIFEDSLDCSRGDFRLK
jgi:hypothetical protein